MRHERRTREQRKADASARIAFLCFALIALLVAVALRTDAAEPAESEPQTAETEQTDEVFAEDEPPLVSLGTFRVTHYCACKKCCGKEDGITATGTTATEGRTVAVDPTVIPYGSEVAVFFDDGRICYYTAEDSGSAIKGNKLDVFVDGHEEALERGVIGASVYLVRNEVER